MTVQHMCLCDLQGPDEIHRHPPVGKGKEKSGNLLLQHQELRIASRLARQPRRIIISLMMNSSRSICQI